LLVRKVTYICNMYVNKTVIMYVSLFPINAVVRGDITPTRRWESSLLLTLAP
jgi:hypothetical protein